MSDGNIKASFTRAPRRKPQKYGMAFAPSARHDVLSHTIPHPNTQVGRMLRSIQQHRHNNHAILRQAATTRGAGPTHPLQHPPHSCSLWTQSTLSLGLRRLDPEAHADLQRLLQHGQLESAMARLSSLRGQGLYPAPGLVDHFTRLCVNSRRREVAWGMLRQEGIPAHVATYKTLLESYARPLPPSQEKVAGSLQQQQQQQQQLPQAFRLLEEMKTLHHVRPDAACYLVVLQGCAKTGEWQEAMRLRKELLSSLATSSEMEGTDEAAAAAAAVARKKSLALLLQALARDGQLAKALNLLQDHAEIGNSDMNAVAALLEGGMAREGGMEEALGIVTSLRNTPWWLRQEQDLQHQHQHQNQKQQMGGKTEGGMEEAFTLALLQACKRLGLWQEAQHILRTSPLSSSITTTTTSPTVYYSLAIGACGRASPPQPQAALDLFHSMGHPPDAITYLELLRTCSAGQRGNDAVALLLRPSLPSPLPSSFQCDLRSYHGAMRVCLQTKEYSTVLRLWASLRAKGGREGGLAPSDVTCNYLVRACLNSGRWREALRALEQSGVLGSVAGVGGMGGGKEGRSGFTGPSFLEGRTVTGAAGLDIEGDEDEDDAMLHHHHYSTTTTITGSSSSSSSSSSHQRRRPNGPILLRELYLVALTAYERESDWPRFLHTLHALARHLGGPQDEDEDGGEDEVEEEDTRLTRTCNRAVTCAVRERKWEVAIALHKGMQQAGLRVRPDLMAYNATMKGTFTALPPSLPPLPFASSMS